NLIQNLGGDKINFLDVTIFNDGNRFGFDWYRKPTFSGRFLNFNSNHPMAQKRGTILSLIDRTFLLSDFRFHTQNLTFIINILLDNDYPLTFIFDTVNQRIKNLIRNRHITQRGLADNVGTNESVSWLTVSFIPFHTEKFKRFNKNDIRVSFRSPNKLNKYIKVQKDICPHTSRNNIVYKISCNNCDASYMRQTSRKLKTRIAEHHNHIRYNTSGRSVVTEHRRRLDHEFKWDEVVILEEPCYRRRLVSEMLNIRKQKNGLNLQTDTDGLHKAYILIINKV
ncbi:hypothetical protein ALC56_10583, partial [Trachymyrmex septentrionalis]